MTQITIRDIKNSKSNANVNECSVTNFYFDHLTYFEYRLGNLIIFVKFSNNLM